MIVGTTYRPTPALGTILTRKPGMESLWEIQRNFSSCADSSQQGRSLYGEYHIARGSGVCTGNLWRKHFYDLNTNISVNMDCAHSYVAERKLSDNDVKGANGSTSFTDGCCPPFHGPLIKTSRLINRSIQILSNN